MDLGGDGVRVYAEAKSEYTTQLCQYLVPSIQQFFLDLLEEAKLKEAEPRRVLVMFQTLLEGISDWNADKVQRETTQIATKSRCDYLEELMTAVFIAHTKVLSAIRLTTKQKKLQITIPKLEHFLHRTLTECARLLWSSTYLFSTTGGTIERQKNLRLIETMLHEGVLQGIRGMLPVKNILREYLKDDGEGDEAEAEAEAEEEAEVKSEAKPEVKPEAKPEPKPEPEVKETVETHHEVADVSGVAIEFTGNDTEIDTATAPPENATATENIGAEIEGDAEEVIQILDEPPEAMDGFEDIDVAESILPMEFEELS
jgi:hypothetical protein